MDSLVAVMTVIAAVAAGLMAGVYYAFSGFVMRSLNQLGDQPATDAMNAINEVILRSGFMVVFFGSSALFFALAVVAVMRDSMSDRWMPVTAALIYLIGMFCCTVVFNVPLNNRLARAASGEFWQAYYAKWTWWNHLRTMSCLLSMVLCIVFLMD